MASENPVVGLLQELKQTQTNEDKNLKQITQKQRYKVRRPMTPFDTFRKLIDAAPANFHDAVCGDIIYEYWDDRHFRSTWIERKNEKELWDKKVLDGAEGTAWKWRTFLRCRSAIEPRRPHIQNAREDWNYWIGKRGVPEELMTGTWSDPTAVIGKQEGWNQGTISLDQAIPPFRREGKWGYKHEIGWEWGDYDVEIENTDVTA
jgi:hypothetical protein